MSRAQPHRLITVYDGSRLLGTVRETADRQQWVAISPHGEVLGEFLDAKSAAAAVTQEHDRRSADHLRKARAQ